MTTDTRVCSFCLGGNTDIPPFGSLSDAEDLVRPCSTCSLTAHRKCLLDWFNSLPSDKLQVVEPSVAETSIRRNSEERNNDVRIGQEQDETRIHIHISPQSLNQWISNLMNRIRESRIYHSPNEQTASVKSKDTDYVVVLLAACPQCKQDIIFKMKRSAFLSAISDLRTATTRSIQYTGFLLGLTSAFTGIASVFYVGLTSCGLKILESLVPTSVLIRMLTVSNPVTQRQSSALSNLLFGNSNAQATDNLEIALTNGLIDPLKFSRVPMLPIAMYTMRSSSLLSCIFPNSKELITNKWVTEILLDSYISSLGNHELAIKLFTNIRSILSLASKDPLSILSCLRIFKDIDFTKPSCAIAFLIPLRWSYDFFFRVTFNTIHFQIAKKIRPQDIANTVSAIELDRLERFENEMAGVRSDFNNLLASSNGSANENNKEGKWPVVSKILNFLKRSLRVIKGLASSNILWRCFKLHVASRLFEMKACLRNDYSEAFLYRSIIMKCLTTVAWPFISSKVGYFIFKFLQSNLLSNMPKERSMLLSNILGLVGVVLVKDCANLYLSGLKAKQISEIDFMVHWPF